MRMCMTVTGFSAVMARQVLDLPLAALGAHDLGQRADGSFVDIRHLKTGGVHLVAQLVEHPVVIQHIRLVLGGDGDLVGH